MVTAAEPASTAMAPPGKSAPTLPSGAHEGLGELREAWVALHAWEKGL